MRKRRELFAPAIVLTARQTAGRGRAGNTWWSNAGVLTVTFALAAEEHLAPHQLPLVAGLAVRNAAAELTGNPAIGLKWPNDVVCGGLKLAGLLCERLDRLDLIGVGLNVNLNPFEAPPTLRRRITSLATLATASLDMTQVLVVLARHMRQTISRRNHHPFASLIEEYRNHHALTGCTVTVAVPGSQSPALRGRCEGLDDSGRLLIRSGGRLHPVVTGSVCSTGD